MDKEQQLRLQAFLDGELSGAESGEMARLTAEDKAAAGLFSELRQTREALRSAEPELKLPETREFYWSKIQAAIEREGRRVPERETGVPWFARLRRLLVPMAGVALVAFCAVFGLQQAGRPGDPVVSLETAQAFTYRDFSSGTTLVWLSYPADNRVAGEDEPVILD